VKLSIFNILGQKVATLVDGNEEAGRHELKFDGAHLASGMYFCTLRAGAFMETRKLLILR
jgi:hypothetical protein